jgi:8-oxo-dGTP pyrophosphatase MutT (NUDIX family)
MEVDYIYIAGEELADTAKREVFEETGVEAEFISVISFRHLHNFRYGCSDWYFVCLMKPITEEIKPCPHEIGGCKWVEVLLIYIFIVQKNMTVVICCDHIAACSFNSSCRRSYET